MSLRPTGSLGRASVVVTDRGDGDFAVTSDPSSLDRRRRSIVDRPWTWLRQVHGADVVGVGTAGGGAGTPADALVTAAVDAPLAVHVADCAPVVLVGRDSVGAAHAGWRGLRAGVLGAAVKAMRDIDTGPIDALLGPCICPRHYEFGADLLDELADQLGPTVCATTAGGRPALDIPAAVEAALGLVDVPVVERLGGCTAEHPERWYSHRARGDRGRMAMVAWLE